MTKHLKKRRKVGESVTKEYFESRVQVDSSTQCWNWSGYKNANGYGGMRDAGRATYCHRVVYRLWKGPIPCGLLVCHKCDNRACCNPDHLFVGTYADNSMDCSIKGRFRPQNTKLSSEQVIAIRNDQRRQRAIAADYKISQATVSDIKTRRRRFSVS
jgi:hypothetical protein